MVAHGQDKFNIEQKKNLNFFPVLHNRQSLSTAIKELKNIRRVPRKSYNYQPNSSNQNTSLPIKADNPTNRYSNIPEFSQSSDYFSKSTNNAIPSPIIDTHPTSQGNSLINSIYSSSSYNPKLVRPKSTSPKDQSIPKPTTSHIHLPDTPPTISLPSSPRYTVPPRTHSSRSTRQTPKLRKRPRVTPSARSNRQNSFKKFPSEKTKNHVHFTSLSIQPSPSMKNDKKYYKFGLHLLTETNEHKRAALYLKKSADLGNVKASSLYGQMLYEGDGVEKDVEEAAGYLKIGADSGDIDSIRIYAAMCKTGNGVEYSLKEAVKYFMMAADSGDIESAKNIVGILESGCQFLLSKREAANYYKMLADKGDAVALEKYNSINSKLKK